MSHGEAYDFPRHVILFFRVPLLSPEGELLKTLGYNLDVAGKFIGFVEKAFCIVERVVNIAGIVNSYGRAGCRKSLH